jgi:flagellar biosynthesis protein FliR
VLLFSMMRVFGCLFISSLVSLSKQVTQTRCFFSVEMCFRIILFLEQESQTTSPQFRQWC